jgi:hypothetical protein
MVTVSAILWSQRFWKEAKIQVKWCQLSNFGSTCHSGSTVRLRSYSVGWDPVCRARQVTLLKVATLTPLADEAAESDI